MAAVMRKTKLLQVVTVLIISISNAHSKGMNTVNSPSLIFNGLEKPDEY